MSASSISVQLDHVVKRHGTTVAVADLSLAVNQGEFFSILGPSGSGKTTLLRLIAGLDHPDAGTIVIAGQSMNGQPSHKRPVNTVFQQYALFPHMTVWQNIAFGLQMQRLPDSEIRDRVEKILQMVQMSGKSQRLPTALSGGEQQRVALARALVNHPKVLLLDEPLGALDQQLRQEMQRELKRIQQQVGITFMCVTHHQEEALLMSDRIAVLSQGKVIQVGTPQELYNYPVSLFVAQFVGLSNRLEGEVLAHGDGLGTFRSAGVAPFQVPMVSQNGNSHPSTFVIRPERVALRSPGQPAPGQNSLLAKVEGALYLGGEMQYHVVLPGGTIWIIRSPIVSQNYTRFSPGDQVAVCWELGEGVLLHAS